MRKQPNRRRLLVVALLSTVFAAVVPYGRASEQFHKTFTFGALAPDPSNILVRPDSLFSDAAGHGFEPGAKIASITDKHATYCAGEGPFYFSVAVGEGNYRVTVTFPMVPADRTPMVKAELRRLMLEPITLAPAEPIVRSFIVNVRTPKIPGGQSVRLKVPRETIDEAWAWDGKLTLEFNAPRPCLAKLEIEKVDVPTVFILGDSTVCDQPHEPYASWGQMLPRFFKPDIAVANHAESGETLASSSAAHRLDKVLSVLKAGDYVLIQYGHNDMKSKAPDAAQVYKATLKKWVQQIKSRGGIAVLITSMNRHSFSGDQVINSLREYPQMVREAASEENVAMVDLNRMSKTLYEALGPHDSIRLFKHNPDLSQFDGTHHSSYGAYELAKCVVEGIRQGKLALAEHLADDVRPFDPSKPDAETDVQIAPSPGVVGVKPLGD